jgi:ABC-type antimicrobial peptide transport system permease subunit
MGDEWVIVTAYADGSSGVPGLAPAADQAAGAAALGSLVRYFMANPPKRSVLFVATSAHFQAMQGIRAFIEQRFRKGWDITDGKTPQCIFTLDLSTRSSSISSTAKGWWFDYRDENHENERPISRRLFQYAPKIAEAQRMDVDRICFDGINNPDGRHWKNSVPGRYGVDSEIINMAGPTSMTFITNSDVRDLQDTPHDTADRVNTGNLLTQTRTIACLLHHALNDSQDEIAAGANSMPYRGGRELARMSLMAGFGTVQGRVLRYDPQRSFLPDVPVVGALVEYAQFYRTYMGIRGGEVHRAIGENAEYSIYGVPTVSAWGIDRRFPVAFMSYLLKENGEIEYASDFGIQGDGQFSSYFLMTTSHRQAPMVVFPCTAIQFLGLVDPHQFRGINNLEVLDARNNGSPPSFSFLAPYGAYGLRSFVEPSAVVFAPSGRRLKLIGGAGFIDLSLIILNSTESQADGLGFTPSEPMPHFPAALQAANDLWRMNESRRGILAKHHISNAGLDEIQQSAKTDIEAAIRAYSSLDYPEGDRLTQRAWGLALRAHPQYKKTMSDIVNGLIFFLALLLPFCYFLERLLFSKSRLSTQILFGAIMFVAFFGLLRLLHPAFDVTGSTFMIFVAFSIGSLSLIVITFVIGKFETSLHKLQQIATGVHDERVGKVSLAVTALSIGISNMRRRKARTILTSATLVLVTFIVLSFTSVVTDFRFNETDAEGTPRYAGILVRDRELQPIENSAYIFLTAEFADAAVSRRAWFYGGAFGSLSSLSLRRDGRSLNINALLGLDPQESGVTRPQEALLAGRWFVDGDRNVTILPRSLADRLGVSREDVGNASVRFGGVELRVVGMVDDASFKSVTDLDNESVIPADFTQSRQMQDRGQGGEFAFRKYVRYDPGSVLIVPASFALGIGAELRSVGIGLRDYAATERVMADLMPRIGLNLYAGVSGERGPVIKQFSTVAATKSRGFEYVVIPVLIAVMIVLNTMIASVLERQREIGIFSAVGLSPKQIAALFFAESLVYAIIGAVSGYLLAQIVGVLVANTGWFEGLSLNYSSLSGVYAVLIVVAVVLLSTLYPAKRAREIATPSGDAEWFTNSPTVDEWAIELPFTVSQSHASALALFYAEWLRSYEDYNIGEFVTEKVRTSAGKSEYRTSAKCWLAPFDLGVQQEMHLVFVPTDMQDVYKIELHLERVSGDPENWENLNRRFLKALRKQFLVWRTLSPDEKLPYLQPATG